MFVVGCVINRSEYVRYNLFFFCGFYLVYKYYDDKCKGLIWFNYKSINLYYLLFVVWKDCVCFVNVF